MKRLMRPAGEPEELILILGLGVVALPSLEHLRSLEHELVKLCHQGCPVATFLALVCRPQLLCTPQMPGPVLEFVPNTSGVVVLALIRRNPLNLIDVLFVNGRFR